MSFVLHPKLAADTAMIADWTLSRALLMNDRRFAWVILVPRKGGITELFDLDESSRTMLTEEISRAGERLKIFAKGRGGGDKINIGMIGNLVPQLHVHVVARSKSDRLWPAPVWGTPPISYEPGELRRLAAELRDAL